MSRRVLLHRWKVSQVGVLGEGSVEVGPLSPGVNVISGPNECGKSTMIEALRVALFERHSFRGKAVKALQPHGLSVTPAVELELDVDGTRYRLEKRFRGTNHARLYQGDDPVPLENERVDERLRDLLGAHEGNKHGTSEDDMGLWGLLWVKQDEFATSEPGARLGASVKSDLADAFQQQVGDLLGGGDGVRLRDAIEERFTRYYTPKNKQPTNELASLERRLAELDQELAESERALKEIERAGDELLRAEHVLEALDEERQRWQRDIEALHAQLAAGQQLEREALDAEAALSEVIAAQERARTAVAQREALRVSALEAVEAARAQSAACEAQRRRRDALRAELQTAESALRDATGERDALRDARDALSARIERADRARELRTLARDLDEARRLHKRLEDHTQRLAALPDPAALERAVELQRRRNTLAEDTRRRALRIEHGGEVTPILRQTRVALGAWGEVVIDPPRQDFVERQRRWRNLGDELQLALARAGVGSVTELRAMVEAHAQREQLRAPPIDALKRLCPNGIDALSAKVEALQSDEAELARRLKHARELDAARLEHAAQMDWTRVDPARAKEATELALRIGVLREELERAAVKLTVRPLVALRVQLDDGEAPRLVTPEAPLQRSVTRALRLTIDERAEVHVDPGEATKTGVEIEAREAELAALLSALGVEDLDALRARQERFDAAQRLHDGVVGALQATAPKGIAALEEERARAREQLRQLGGALDEARAAEARLRELPALPAVDRARWEEVDALDRRWLREERELRRCAGRIEHAEGPIAAHWPAGEELLMAPEGPPEGPRIVLGACDPQALEHVEAQLQGARAQLPEGELYALQALAAQRDPIEAARREDLASLQRLAPLGVDALSQSLTARRAELDAPDEDPEERAPLERQREARQRALDDAHARVEREAETVRRRRDELHTAEEGLGELDRALAACAERAHAAEANLLGARALQGDEALAEARREVDARVDARTEARDERAARLSEAMLPRLREELESYTRELGVCTARIEREKESISTRRGALAEMQRQGRFDLCEDRRDEREAVYEELLRVRADAEAVKLLWRVAREEYEAAHERLLTPVYQAAQPLLKELWPDARLTLDHASLLVRTVERGAAAETFKDLSGGAREQLAVIVRVAMARVLARDHASMPLILDDILGWTDDERLRRMLRVIELAARDMQVIVLTCHPQRFSRFVHAKQWSLPELKR